MITISASEAPVVLGLVPHWKSPYALFCEKRHPEVYADLDEEDDITLRIGQLLEGAVLDLTQEQIGRPITRNTASYTSWTHPFMTATPDGLIYEDGVVETVEVKTAQSMSWRDAVPAHYYAQVQQQMHVIGASHGYIAALLRGIEFRWARLPYDAEFITELIAVEQDFVRRVEENDPPAIDGTAATRRAIDILRSRTKAPLTSETPPVYQLPDVADDYYAEYRAAKDEEKAAALKVAAIRNRILALLPPDTDIGIGRTFKVMYKNKRMRLTPLQDEDDTDE